MKNSTTIYRDASGVPHVEAENLVDLYWGEGYVHATDRGMQLLLMRILGQGRASELLDASDETLAVDTFFRRMNWTGGSGAHVEMLTAGERELLGSYCDGINAALQKKVPWEFKLFGYRPEPWCGEDTVLISRMIAYLTLAQSQGEMERLLVEMVQADISREKLEALFPGLLGGLDLELVKKVTLGERVVEPEALWNRGLPRMMASNNWVVSGEKTASGKPIVCNDPHLEINRLPNVWAEIVLVCGNKYACGSSMPGFPGILTGRTADIAWGVTYAFVDATDSWIEKCRDGQYYREEGDRWVAFDHRREVIKRKKKADAVIDFYENDHGVLDGDPHIEGNYLATRWAAADSGAGTLKAIFAIWDNAGVDGAMEIMREMEGGWSAVMADNDGNIGFQMTGRVPMRREGISGFVPLAGWKSENDWQGILPPGDLPCCKNPDTGFFATANEDLNRYGKASPINMPMGPYRADRIAQLLKDRQGLTAEDMYAMHRDLHSLQAQRFMEILKPLLPDTPQGRILVEWDLCYDADSEGAFLFDRFYRSLHQSVFGKNGMGEAVVEHLTLETGIFNDFYYSFDCVLLAQENCWFGDRSRDEIYREAAAAALDVPPQPWGRGRDVVLTNILFGGKLPSFLGFDRGPITGVGNLATIHQGQIYRSGGRDTTFMPSLRMVTDLAETGCHSHLVGGPSDRRFSRWYCSDLENWIKGRYKSLVPETEGAHLPL